MGGWLTTSAGGRSPDEIQEEAENAVAEAAAKLRDPLIGVVAGIYSEHLFDTGMADEWLVPAEKFVRLFRGEQICLNEGVADLDFVRGVREALFRCLADSPSWA